MEFAYQTIKDLAKQTGRKVTDLIALASQNDPFYVGTPNDIAMAEWFAEFYHNNYPPGQLVHVRRCHYKILSLSINMPNGKPYGNSDQCWDFVLQASKAARYLRLVDVDLFVDRKNEPPVDCSISDHIEPEITVYGLPYLDMPSFPDLPVYSLERYQSEQPYHLEIWTEKTTMNDILLPLCRRYHAVLQTGAGELSITASRALARRIAQCGKPTRVLYISDYDPGGLSMPVAVARKLEYFVRAEGIDADIRLFPLVLTSEQVAQYNLPRSPIKESERRKSAFEAMHGEGATELDALEALYPGELERIVRECLERYYDPTLNYRTREHREDLEHELRMAREVVLERYDEEIEEARQELEDINADPRIQAYLDRIAQLWQYIERDLQHEAPDLDQFRPPEAREARELGDGLYNSSRDYLQQIDSYKEFQGKQRKE